jgi:hypothetical protein
MGRDLKGNCRSLIQKLYQNLPEVSKKKELENPFMLAGVTTEFGTKYLLNTSLVCYRDTSLLDI